MGAQWHYVRLTLSNEGNIAHDSTALILLLLSSPPNRLAVAASAKEEAEWLLGKEK